MASFAASRWSRGLCCRICSGTNWDSPARTSDASTACAEAARSWSTAMRFAPVSCSPYRWTEARWKRSNPCQPTAISARIQRAMSSEHGLQCGFCTPGILMSLHAARKKSRACRLRTCSTMSSAVTSVAAPDTPGSVRQCVWPGRSPPDGSRHRATLTHRCPGAEDRQRSARFPAAAPSWTISTYRTWWRQPSCAVRWRPGDSSPPIRRRHGATPDVTSSFMRSTAMSSRRTSRVSGSLPVSNRCRTRSSAGTSAMSASRLGWWSVRRVLSPKTWPSSSTWSSSPIRSFLTRYQR